MIAAEGEHKASRALRHAAEVICDSPAALQVIIVVLVVVVIIIISIIIVLMDSVVIYIVHNLTSGLYFSFIGMVLI